MSARKVGTWGFIFIALAGLGTWKVVSLKQLDELLRDVTGFNKHHNASHWNKINGKWPNYDVMGLNLQSSSFNGIIFSSDEPSGIALKNSEFKDCAFTDCVFRHMVWEGLVFENCKFKNCRFEAVRWNKIRMVKPVFEGNVFTDTELDGTIFENLEFVDPVFNGTIFDKDPMISDSKFLSPIFRNTAHVHGTFYDCEFTSPRFENVKFDNTTFIRGFMDRPVYMPLETSGAIWATSVRILGGLQIKPIASKQELFNFSGYHIGTSFDLSALEGRFGCNGGENVSIHDYSGLNKVGIVSSPLKNSKIWNIKASEFAMRSGGDEVTVDNIDADYVYLEESTFKNCSFSNIRVRKELIMDNARFENCTWKNIKLDSGATMTTEGAVFVGDKPF